MLLRLLAVAAAISVVGCGEAPTPAEPLSGTTPRYTALAEGTRLDVWTTTVAMQVGDRLVVTDFVEAPVGLCVTYAGDATGNLTGNGSSSGPTLFKSTVQLPLGTKIRLIQRHINCSGGFHFTAEVI